MRIKKLAALVAVVGFLFAVNGAGAATEQPKVGSGPLVGGYSSLEPMTEGYCESSCCWASGCNVECSSSFCRASCGTDDTSITYCDAT